MDQEIKKRIEDINNGIVPEGYKQTPFGIFPCDWETISLEEVSTSKGEYGLNAPACDRAESLPRYIRITDIDDNGNYIDTGACVEFVDSTKQYTLKSGDIVFARTGATVGRNYLYKEKDGELLYAGFLIRFSIDRKIANPYIVYANCNTKQYWSWIKKISARSGQPGVNAEEYGQYKFIAAKDKTEQGKIAEILMKWDKMVELQEQYIQKLELRKKSIMKKLLTPKDGWKKCRLNELVYKEKGKAVKIDNEGSFPIIDMEYLDKGVFTNYTNEKGILANEQDILLLWDGASAGTLLTGVKGVVGSTFALLTLKNDKTCSKYLYYWLTIENLKNVSLREGSGIPHMPKDYLQKQVVKYPILDKQINISKTLALLEEEISLQKEKLAKIKEQRKAMQQYLLTGIVRVS